MPVQKATECAVKMLKAEQENSFQIKEKKGHNVEQNGTRVSTPKKKKKKQEPHNKYVIDDMDKSIIRQHFQQYYEQYKEIPTWWKLHNFSQTELSFKTSKEILGKIVLATGFHFRRCQNKHIVLCEQEDIVAKRTYFLRYLCKNLASELKQPVV